MNQQVKEYLAKYQAKKREEEQKIKAEILIDAGLYIQGEVEITSTEAFNIPYSEVQNLDTRKDDEGIVHYYYRKGKVPLEVTDEEYAAILETIPKKEDRHEQISEEEKKKDTGNIPNIYQYEETLGRSFAESFFKVIAWILWIGGLILSVVVANETVQISKYSSSSQFDFMTFFSSFIIYFISGCVSMCFSELFNKLQAILNEQKKTNSLLGK